MGKLLHHSDLWLPHLNMGTLLVGLPQNIYHFQTLFQMLGIHREQSRQILVLMKLIS